jgi:3-hydroxyisobutyrate dehydrogenase
MVSRLADAGYPVRAYDVVPRAVSDVAQHGKVTGVDALTDVATGAGVVILMLPSSAEVDEVLLGQGLLAALAAGTVVVDMSSSEPARTRQLADRAGEAGIRFADAPVSGGVAGAQDGTLTIMVGASDELFASLSPLLGAMGSRVRHCGPVGAGHAVKALNNLMSATHLLATSEAMIAAIEFGLDPSTVLDVVNGSSGRSGSTETKWPRFVLPETYDSGFGFRLMLKDARIALELMRSAGVPADLSSASVELWAQAADELDPTADHTEIARWLQQRSRAQPKDNPRHGRT